MCPSCATDNPAGARFCGGCGAPLSQVCAACGAANDPSMRFCTQCGSALAADAAAPPAAPRPRAEPVAERAVRAALDLVEAVPALEPRLSARAGVLTGEAAVTVGAEGQGMVAGDLVNTASRAQAVAAPGSVLVGESTKRATEAAIAYD